MVIVDPVAGELAVLPEPGEITGRTYGLELLPAVLTPLGLRGLAQDVGYHEWSDVPTHAIVQVWRPAEWLFIQGLPAHEDVVVILALEDQLELPLEFLRSGQT